MGVNLHIRRSVITEGSLTCEQPVRPRLEWLLRLTSYAYWRKKHGLNEYLYKNEFVPSHFLNNVCFILKARSCTQVFGYKI